MSYQNRQQMNCESVKKISSNDDLITEILVQLPIPSLIRFKSVSKHWLSLITGPHLPRLRLRFPDPLRSSALWIMISNNLRPQYRYVPLNNEQRPQSHLTFPTSIGDDNLEDIRVLQSRNGLLLCSSNSSSSRTNKYFVYNPTTHNFTTIPLPPQQLTGKNYFDYEQSQNMCLAFDPSISSQYKLVFPNCVENIGYENCIYEMVIYSSETRVWRVCGERFITPYHTSFLNGVYLNGAVHWSKICIYFKLDEELLQVVPVPRMPYNTFYSTLYTGESGGRLHLVTINDNPPYIPLVFDVYEMEKDRSKWCLRYQIDLSAVCLDSCIRIEVVTIVRGEREEDSFLVFNVLMDDFIKFMKYRFADKTFKMLFQIVNIGGGNLRNEFSLSKAFELIPSLSPV